MSQNPLPTIQSVTIVASTKWLSLQTLQYTDPYDGNKIRYWDCVSRKSQEVQEEEEEGDDDNNNKTNQESVSKLNNLGTDAVIILPLLHKSDGSIDTILVEQFRPPVQCMTLEFPAGLVDANETIEDAALRELYEETGYVGKVSSIQHLPLNPNNKDDSFLDNNNSMSSSSSSSSCQLCMSPGLADELVQVVIVQVDCTKEENQNHPKQHLDEGEYITLHRVPLTSGLRLLMEQELSNKTSAPKIPIMGLYMFALGLEIGSKLK